MKRRLVPFLLAPLLVSCSAEDVATVLGPKPDAELARLADHAHAEGREADATELEAEIARLCGTHGDGTVPDTCTYSPGEVAPGDSFLLTVDAVDAVPAESRDLVARQALALAPPGESGEPGDVVLSGADAAQARELLHAEYAYAYGLQVAGAFGADVGKLIDAADSRITLLREVLAPTGDVPVAEPGYEVTGTLSPADEGFVDEAQEQLQAAWLTAVSDATDDPWREWLARAA